MSNLATNVVRVYGGTGIAGDTNPAGQNPSQSFSPSNSGVTEQLAVGTYRRAIAGPKQSGHFSLHTLVDSAAGAASALTVWYSNHPNPSIASDADWVQDASITAQDLTAATGKFVNVGNMMAEWIMVKVVIAASPGQIRVFARTEGTSVAMR